MSTNLLDAFNAYILAQLDCLIHCQISLLNNDDTPHLNAVLSRCL